jgi:hypothetical protein
VNQPETITSNGVHVWIHHRNSGSRGHHGFDRIAPFAQNIAARLCGQMVRGHMHAAHCTQCTNHGYSFEKSWLTFDQHDHQSLLVIQGFFDSRHI